MHLEKLVNLNFVVAGITLMCGLASPVAMANCESRSLEGKWRNSAGGVFKIKQPSCDEVVVLDVQKNKEYTLNLDGTKNEIEDLLDSRLGTIKQFSDQEKGAENQIILTFEGELPLGEKDLAKGYENPTLRADMTVEQRGAGSLQLQLGNVRAVAGKGAGAVQKALVRGLNLAVQAVRYLGSSTGQVWREDLTRVN